MNMEILTTKQFEALKIIAEHIKEHGISPILGEIAAKMSIQKPTVYGHVLGLVAAGALTKKTRAQRSLILTEDAEALLAGLGRRCVACGHRGPPAETSHAKQARTKADA